MRMIPYGRQYLDKKDIDSVLGVLKSDWITQGPKIAEFEFGLARYCGAKYAVAVSSGTAALHLAVLSAGLKKGDEVITTPITFAATANAALYAGAKPVFSDIERSTLNINPVEILKNINHKTRAILPVHFAGLPCNMDKISDIAKKKDLIVIEDACHALGAEYRCAGKWIKVGSSVHSDMSVLSFHPVKSITTGEGGAILTNRKDLYEKLIMLRNHGITKDGKMLFKPKEGPWYYEMQSLGFNYRLTDIQAALGISQLKKLDRFVNLRRKITKLYNEAFADLEEKIILPCEFSSVKSSCHLYVIRLMPQRGTKAKRGRVFDYLRKNGIGSQIHYIPVYAHPYYRKLGYRAGTCPVAEEYYNGSISLPLYPSLTGPEIKKTIKVVRNAILINT